MLYLSIERWVGMALQSWKCNSSDQEMLTTMWNFPVLILAISNYFLTLSLPIFFLWTFHDSAINIHQFLPEAIFGGGVNDVAWMKNCVGYGGGCSCWRLLRIQILFLRWISWINLQFQQNFPLTIHFLIPLFKINIFLSSLNYIVMRKRSLKHRNMGSLEIIGDATEELLVVELVVIAEKKKGNWFKNRKSTLYFVSPCCSCRFHHGAYSG